MSHYRCQLPPTPPPLLMFPLPLYLNLQELASLEQLLSQRNQQVVESEATKRSMQVGWWGQCVETSQLA
jgi:hypothetical protein